MSTTKLSPAQLVEAVAVIIMASQKSAPVAVTVVSYITYDAQLQGILAIPAIIYFLMIRPQQKQRWQRLPQH